MHLAAFRRAIRTAARTSCLEQYEKWCEPQRIDFASLVGAVLYGQHWGNWKELLDLMDSPQKVAVTLRAAAANALANKALQGDSPRSAGSACA